MPGFFRLSSVKLPDVELPLPIFATTNYTDEQLNAKFMERQFVSAAKVLNGSGFEVGGFVLFKSEVIAFPADP
jgi:hypothetical protein